MRVGIDVSVLFQTRAGTARYVSGLLPQLRARTDVRLRSFHLSGSSALVNGLRDVVWYPFSLPAAAARARLDVLHCPTFRAPVRSQVPVVVTVHDLAVLRVPETFPAWSRAYSRRVVPSVVRSASRVIAVSEFTKRELLELLDVDEGRIRVVPNAIAAAFDPEGPAARGEYVLGVGTLEPRKNLARLVEAARRARVELRIVGARGWGGVSVNGRGVQWLGEVSDEELAALYRGSLCVAYPSLYEGFGIPVLEALACGAPVVTSAGSAMAEVADGAAVFVDPLDPDAIADGIRQAVSQRERLRGVGLERARAFDWARVTEQTVAVYREAADDL